LSNGSNGSTGIPSPKRIRQEAEMNVFEFALKMEEDGKKFYETLAAETSLPELKRIYSLLASAEEEHRKAIESIKNDTAPGNADSKILEHVKNVFQGLLEKKNLLKVLERDNYGCRRAIRLAMAGINLYDKMAAKETSPTTAKILAMLAKEERRHLEIMENIYDFVEAPKDFLAWGESSNLKEF
jgi:rubrerythrin